MKVVEIPMRAPTGTPIVGIVNRIGGISTVRCLFSRDGGGNNFFYEVPADMFGEIDINYVEEICVDQHGQRWTLADVQSSLPLPDA